MGVSIFVCVVRNVVLVFMAHGGNYIVTKCVANLLPIDSTAMTSKEVKD